MKTYRIESSTLFILSGAFTLFNIAIVVLDKKVDPNMLIFLIAFFMFCLTALTTLLVVTKRPSTPKFINSRKTLRINKDKRRF